MAPLLLNAPSLLHGPLATNAPSAPWIPMSPHCYMAPWPPMPPHCYMAPWLPMITYSNKMYIHIWVSKGKLVIKSSQFCVSILHQQASTRSTLCISTSFVTIDTHAVSFVSMQYLYTCISICCKIGCIIPCSMYYCTHIINIGTCTCSKKLSGRYTTTEYPPDGT